VFGTMGRMEAPVGSAGMTAQLRERLAEVRRRTLALVEAVSDQDLHRPLSPIM